MKKNNLNMLSKELRQAGAKPDDIAPLALIADRLSLLRPTITHQSKRWLVPAIAGSCAGLAAAVWLVVAAQAVLPGSQLYPVKRLSEQAAVMFDSNYRATIMMRRASEVQQLVNAHADSHSVMATLAAYQSEATTYKSGKTNYAAFEYCKSQLQRAEPGATPDEQRAIRSTLTDLQDV